MKKLALREGGASLEAKTNGHSQQGRVRPRPLMLMERTMYRDGHTPFTSVFSIQLLGYLDECQLRKALRCVQSKHPLLRCVVEELWDRPHFVLQDNPRPIPLRIVDRLNEDQWQQEVRREWITPFQGTSDPLVRLVWLRGPGVHDLILVGHHCICDGQTGIGLLQDFLRACENPECDLHSYDELGGLENIVPPELLQDPKFCRRLHWKRRSLECILWWKTRHRTKPAPIDTETMYFDRYLLGTNITQSIALRAKTEQVTVLAPIALAFMQAFRDVRGTEAFTKVGAMVNARKFLRGIRSDGLFGLAPGVRMRVKDLPVPSSMGIDTFWKRARALKADLDKRVDHLGTGFYQHLLTWEGLHHKYNSVVALFEQIPAIRHLTFSNMGRLAVGTQFGNLRVKKVRSPLVMVSPTPANTVVLSSFAGEMEFAIISDEQSLPRAHAAAISCRTAEILQACFRSST